MEDLSRGLQVDLAVVQIVTTILITTGATIFAGVRFDIAIPSLLDSMAGEENPTSLQESVLSAANNYGFVLTSLDVIMVLSGVLYGSVSLARIRKKSKESLI